MSKQLVDKVRSLIPLKAPREILMEALEKHKKKTKINKKCMKAKKKIPSIMTLTIIVK